MRTRHTKSEKEKEKDRRFKEKVTELLRRYEREVQAVRNKNSATPAAAERSP